MSTSTKLSEEPITNISNNIESSVVTPSLSPDDVTKKTNKSSFLNSAGRFFKSINYRLIAIILILLFLGINIFTYLGSSLDWAKETFTPIFGKLLGSFTLLFGDVTKQTVNVAGKGMKGATDVTTGTITSGIDVLQGQVEKNSDQASKTNVNKEDPNTPINQNNLSPELNTALSHAENNVPSPDDATSTTQKQSSNKSGYCYIGEDRGFRSCIKVNENDICMSGDIFASEAICINPNLRE